MRRQGVAPTHCLPPFPSALPQREKLSVPVPTIGVSVHKTCGPVRFHLMDLLYNDISQYRTEFRRRRCIEMSSAIAARTA